MIKKQQKKGHKKEEEEMKVCVVSGDSSAGLY